MYVRVYLPKEGNPEVGAKISLPRSHYLNDPLESNVKLPVHLLHLLEVPCLLVERLEQLVDF